MISWNPSCLGTLKFKRSANAVIFDAYVETLDELDRELEMAKSRNELSLIEVKCSLGTRADLGRPTTTALENKEHFMSYLARLKPWETWQEK